MKKILSIAVILMMAMFFFAACNEDDDDNSEVGGDQSPMGEVGNEFSISSAVGMEDLTAEVVEIKDGVSKIRVSGTVTDTNLKKLGETIPNWTFGSYDPETGNFSADLKMKFTTEGIVDMLNSAERPFTLVKFDAEVGDTYTCESASGGTLTREVTARSNEDDFPYGFYYIKTITVEEPGRNPAVKKIVYKLNHRFGLVHATVVLQDGSEIDSYLYSFAENK